jgi:hypothetical protein
VGSYIQLISGGETSLVNNAIYYTVISYPKLLVSQEVRSVCKFSDSHWLWFPCTFVCVANRDLWASLFDMCFLSLLWGSFLYPTKSMKNNKISWE